MKSRQNDNLNDKDKALKLFEEAITCEHEGKITKAIHLYQRSIFYWPEHKQAQYNLGIALATSGYIDQAMRALKRALWLEPSFQIELAAALNLDED